MTPRPAAGRRWQATLIVVLVFVAVAGAALAGWWYARESPPHQGPLVLISVNGLSAGRLAAYGGNRVDTPAIDALAADSIVFDRAYTHSPQTVPAHASMLSGRLPFEHGVRDDAGFVLDDDARTLAELLRNRGFATGAAVSSFLLRRESGLAQGFSYFDAELPEVEDQDAPAVERDGALTADAAERWLNTQGGQRFFLFVQVGAAEADLVVGRLVQALKDRRLYDDATLILTSDHGESASVVTLDEAALHVPLIVKQPGSDGAGRQIATAVQLIDIVPTVLDLVRAPMPSGLRGRSLRAVLDSEDSVLADQPLYAESLAATYRFGGQGVFALTRGRHRFVSSGTEALIDLEQDGADIALDVPEAGRLRSELERVLAGRTVARPAGMAAADESHYAVLGYLPGARLASAPPASADPGTADALIGAQRAAAQLAGKHEYPAAIDRLRALARAHPALPIVHYQLALVLARAERLDDAVPAFRAAARLAPDAPEIPIALAGVLLRAGQHEDAATQAALALALAERQAYDEPTVTRARQLVAEAALTPGDSGASLSTPVPPRSRTGS